VGAAPGATATTAVGRSALAGFRGRPRLRELVELALQNNRDLRVAVLSIEQARAQYQIRRADQVPTVNAAATGNRQPRPMAAAASAAPTPLVWPWRPGRSTFLAVWPA
jgi:multidrug efflux system outer membrane protein